MTIKERISADYLTAFKAKETFRKTLLGTIKGEFQTMEKNRGVDSLDDETALAILTKFSKNAKQTLEAGDLTAKDELVIIESYLPKEMTEDEIRTKVKELVEAGATNMGLIMKGFAGLSCDRKMVSTIAKEYSK